MYLYLLKRLPHAKQIVGNRAEIRSPLSLPFDVATKFQRSGNFPVISQQSAKREEKIFYISGRGTFLPESRGRAYTRAEAVEGEGEDAVAGLFLREL